jgi:hypothetical protein
MNGMKIGKDTHSSPITKSKEPAMPLPLAGKVIAGLIAIGSVGASELSPPDTRGQTVFLERLAARVDHARAIAPQTDKTISDLLIRVRSQHLKRAPSAELDARREQAIARIEQALQTKLATGDAQPALQSSPVARR